MKIKTLSIKEVELDFSLSVEIYEKKRYLHLKAKGHNFSLNTWNAQELFLQLLKIKGIKIE